jgi:deoxycytidine triphosphate deaminase
MTNTDHPTQTRPISPPIQEIKPSVTPVRPPAGTLPYQEIIALCDFPNEQSADSLGAAGIIRPCRRENVRSAGYDLRLGDEYYMRDSADVRAREGGNEEIVISRLVASSAETLILSPNRVVIVTILERLVLPDDVVGHISLKMELLLRGLIMANQSQIDAGYQGRIFALLYNLSAHPVNLTLDKPILRLELERLPAVSARPYGGKYKDVTLSKALTEPVWSCLEQIQADARDARQKAKSAVHRVGWTQLGGSLITAVLTILITYFSVFGPQKELHFKQAAIEARFDEIRASAKAQAELSAQVAAFAKQLQETLSENAKLQTRVHELEQVRIAPKRSRPQRRAGQEAE